MKYSLGVIVLVVISALMFGCGHQRDSFQVLQMETKSFDAHFPEMDTNGNEQVSWVEFKNQFPDAEKDVYEAVDLNKDGNIDHDEWHKFKSTSGITTHKSE